MEPTASSTPDPTQNRKPNRFAAILLLCSCLGLFGGFVAHKTITPTYKSEAVFKISSRVTNLQVAELLFSESGSAKHDSYITLPYYLRRSVDKGKLSSLKSFQSFQSPPNSHRYQDSESSLKSEIVTALSSSLDCQQIAPGEPEYRLTCCSSLPGDARIILYSLLDTYQDEITRKQKCELANYKAKLNQIKENSEYELKELDRGQDPEEKLAVLFRLKDVERRAVELEESGLCGFNGPSTQLEVLERPQPGKLIFPVLANFLFCGVAIGFCLGGLVALYGKLFLTYLVTLVNFLTDNSSDVGQLQGSLN